MLLFLLYLLLLHLTKPFPYIQVAYGLNNSWCTDCGGCYAKQHALFQEETPTTNEKTMTSSFEYVSVEFARVRAFLIHLLFKTHPPTHPAGPRAPNPDHAHLAGNPSALPESHRRGLCPPGRVYNREWAARRDYRLPNRAIRGECEGKQSLPPIHPRNNPPTHPPTHSSSGS